MNDLGGSFKGEGNSTKVCSPSGIPVLRRKSTRNNAEELRTRRQPMSSSAKSKRQAAKQ